MCIKLNTDIYSLVCVIDDHITLSTVCLRCCQEA